MARPRDPMLEEFRVVAEKGPDSVEDVCDLFTNDCILEDTSSPVMYPRLSGMHRGRWMGVEPSGRRISYRAVAIYRCNEDCSKVHYETFAYDSATILAQLRGERDAERDERLLGPAAVAGGGK